MPRLVRRAPLSERIKSYLDPWDWLMWVSEELNSNDWDEFAQSHALWLGSGANIVFMVAQANAYGTDEGDDVFKSGGSGWLKWLCNLVVLALSSLAFLNGYYTFSKKRHYRLFEQPIDRNPATPSAQRVRVDSSPMTSSPLRFLQNIISSSSADARAHPDAARDVWEIAVWDPNPLCLELFCLFSPLHVVLYYSTLPVAPLDPQPSVKVVTTLLIGAVLSLHLYLLRSSFSQQTKDNAIIQREVLHEYDNKFVHPRMHTQSRDVAIQTISKTRTRDSSVGVRGSSEHLASEVITYTPTTIINRSFNTNPNKNYASQYDPHNLAAASDATLVRSATAQQTPSLYSTRPPSSSHLSSTSTTTAATPTDFSSPIRPSNTPNPFRNTPAHPHFRPSGDGGGSLGVYSHAASPLRKSASANYLRDERDGSGSRGRDSLGGQGERRQLSPVKGGGGGGGGGGSPLKRISMPGGGRDVGAHDGRGKLERRLRGVGGGDVVARRESGGGRW